MGDRFLLLLWALLVLICAFSSVRAGTESIYSYGKWETAPKVVLCEDAPIDKERLTEALKWWDDRGHQFQIVSPRQDKKAARICSDVVGATPTGYIVVAQLVKQAIREKDDMAVTYYQGGYGNNIEYAKIYLKQETATKDRIVEHEIGHALGFDHTRKEGHMMNLFYIYGGWQDEGLAK